MHPHTQDLTQSYRFLKDPIESDKHLHSWLSEASAYAVDDAKVTFELLNKSIFLVLFQSCWGWSSSCCTLVFIDR